MSVAFVTLGCPKNEVDSDRMAAAVAGSAYHLVDDPARADVVVVNTCSFIQEATEESIATVLDYAHRWAPENKSRKLIVAGCMPSRYGSQLGQAMAEIDAFLPVSDEGGLLPLLADLTGVDWRATEGASPSPVAQRTVSGPSAYVQVSDGCHRACTYCTIPAIRGPYRSRILADIVAETVELVGKGAREIVLIGQDITSWGRDLECSNTIADVVETVARIEGVRWLRLMYAQPDGITDELLDVMAAHDNIVGYLDMPLQHASGDVLRRMARRGDATEYLALISRIRAKVPDIALRTTLIAGFPGETPSDAKLLQRFVVDAGFDYLGVFPFSPEEGTPAAGFTQQIPVRTRRARAQRLRDLADQIGVMRVSRRVGEMIEVLVEGYDSEEDSVVGRWRGQAPEIDGIVLLDRGDEGDIVLARVTDSYGYDLEAEVI